jgi:hypothetical protein
VGADVTGADVGAEVDLATNETYSGAKSPAFHCTRKAQRNHNDERRVSLSMEPSFCITGYRTAEIMWSATSSAVSLYPWLICALICMMRVVPSGIAIVSFTVKRLLGWSNEVWNAASKLSRIVLL